MSRDKNKQVSQALYKKIKPLLPQTKPSAKGGRLRLNDELALNGIVYVLRTGIAWEDLLQELGFGSGMTCGRRLREWQAVGAWHRLHMQLLAELRGASQLDLARASLAGASVPSARGGSHTGPNPTDRGTLGSKRHFVTDRQGLALMFCVTGANRHDSVVFEDLVDARPAVAAGRRRPRARPEKLHADKKRPRKQRQPGAASLGRRACSCLARLLRQAAHSLRTQHPHSFGLALPGMLRYLPTQPQGVLLADPRREGGQTALAALW